MEEKLLERIEALEKSIERPPAKIVSILEAARLFNFPRTRLYNLVDAGKVPYIELENLSGIKKRVIYTESFADWLDDQAKNKRTIKTINKREGV